MSTDCEETSAASASDEPSKKGDSQSASSLRASDLGDSAETVARLKKALEKINEQYMHTRLELEDRNDEVQRLRLKMPTTTATSSSWGGGFYKFKSSLQDTMQKLNEATLLPVVSPTADTHATGSGSLPRARSGKDSTAATSLLLSTVKSSTSGSGRESASSTVESASGSVEDGDSVQQIVAEGKSPFGAFVDSSTHDSRRSGVVEIDKKKLAILKADIESHKTEKKAFSEMLDIVLTEKETLQHERDELMVRCTDLSGQMKRLKQQSSKDAEKFEELIIKHAQAQSQISAKKSKKSDDSEDVMDCSKHSGDGSGDTTQCKCECTGDCLNDVCLEAVRQLNAAREQLAAVSEERDGYKRIAEDSAAQWSDKLDAIVSERNSLRRKVKSLQSDLFALRMSSASDHLTVGAHSHSSSSSIIPSPPAPRGSASVSSSAAPRPPPPPPRCKTGSSGSAEPSHVSGLGTGGDSIASAAVRELRRESLRLKRTHESERTQMQQKIGRLSTQLSDCRSQLIANTASAGTQGTHGGVDFQMLVTSLTDELSQNQEIIESLKSSMHYLGERCISLQKTVDELTERKSAAGEEAKDERE